MGCFADDSSNRDLEKRLPDDEFMTQTSCKENCRKRGYYYAGLQNTNECYCSNTYGKHGEANDCDKECENSPKICGGSRSNTIYETSKKIIYLDTILPANSKFLILKRHFVVDTIIFSSHLLRF